MTYIIILLLLAFITIAVFGLFNKQKEKDSELAPDETAAKPLSNATTSDAQKRSTITAIETNNNLHPIVKGFPKFNYDQERLVGFDLLAQESKDLFYPYVRIPKIGTKIKYPVEGRNSRKGFLENSFCKDFLLKYFEPFIFDNLSFFIKSSRYEPDFAYIDIGNNIFLDIEIDEPYEGISRKPIHYILNNEPVDYYRNVGFVERGWIVVRFSEKQIKEQPIQCCKFLYKLIKSVSNKNIQDLERIEDIKREKMWTEYEAKRMAKENVRETYLNISKFQKSESLPDNEIHDYPGSHKLESNLISVSQTYDKKNNPKPVSRDAIITTKSKTESSTPAPRPYA
jgi:hypothetical protein